MQSDSDIEEPEVSKDPEVSEEPEVSEVSEEPENLPDLVDIEASDTDTENEDYETHSETENEDSDTENDDSETEYGFMHYCLSCEAYYDGYAQCCHEMQHVIYKVNMETREVIGEF